MLAFGKTKRRSDSRFEVGQRLSTRVWSGRVRQDEPLDDLHTGTYGWPPAEKTERLLALLKELKPGVTEILFHASVPTDDFPKVTGSSESRRADTVALTSPAVRKLIAERGIVLTTWRELMARRATATAMP